MSILTSKSIQDIRNTIDSWWEDFVNPQFAPKGIISWPSSCYRFWQVWHDCIAL